MKKLVLLLAVVFSVSFFSCNQTEKVEATVDSAAAIVDSAAATVDSAAAQVDTVAAAAVEEVKDAVK